MTTSTQKIPTGYKQTEIGVIPSDWDVKKLGDVCGKITTGKLNANAMVEDGEYRFYTCAQEYYLINRYAFDTEALLVSGNGANVGYIHYYKGKFNAYQRTYVLSDFVADIQYLKLFLDRNLQERIRVEVNAGNTPYITMGTLTEMQIAVPPSKLEQSAIASALSDTDTLIKKLEKLIEKKKNIKEGAIQELLTCKRRLPGFSGKWEVKILGDLVDVKDGTHQTPRYVDEGIPFYSVESVTRDDFENTKYISNAEHKLLTKNFRIEEGDILMTRIGSIGDCKLITWKPNASFYVSLALLKPKDKKTSPYIYHFSKTSFFKKELEDRSLQWAVPKKINLGEISKVRVYLPVDTREQFAIATALSDMDREIEELELRLTKYENLKQGMMQVLLTGKIRLIH